MTASPTTTTYDGLDAFSSGNVRLLPPVQRTADDDSAEPSPPDEPGDAPARSMSWTIRDCEGAVVGPPLLSRTEALRTIGAWTLRGVGLPLTVYDPDGHATGDRLG